jgi:hypothetical protein
MANFIATESFSSFTAAVARTTHKAPAITKVVTW